MGDLQTDLAAVSQRVYETHAAWVFATPHDAFKVKKPVNLGFLDFSTIEKRRAACEAEVKLNARLAPNVYRGVVPVRRSEDGVHRLEGDGEIVDWAVSMKRMPDARRADVLLENGELDGDAIDRIAAHVASFHASAACTEEDAAFASVEAIERNVTDNFAQARSLAEQVISPAEEEEIERWQLAFVRGHATAFARRIAEKRILDGHGDLRLEHVYLMPDGSITVLDCIEFDARFRIADACADVAFLSMDLTAHGRVELAERLLARYAELTGDYDLYTVVDFYESYRAYVRAKIASFMKHEAEARRFYLLALSADRRSLLAPSLVAVGGLIASGKSTVAARISSLLSAPVVEADRTRKQLLGVAPTERLRDASWKGAYDLEFTEKVYEEVMRRAGVVLASGRPVVIDASFRSRAMRARARELAQRHSVPFRFVECAAPPEVCRKRLRDREGHASVSDGRLEIFDDFRAKYEPVDELPKVDHFVIDTSRRLSDTMRDLAKRIAVWPKGLVA